MEYSQEKLDIVKDQIKRVYEYQFRKGIYYGVKIAANKTFTEEKIANFRFQFLLYPKNYSKKIMDVFTKEIYPNNFIDAKLSKIQNIDTTELVEFLQSYDLDYSKSNFKNMPDRLLNYIKLTKKDKTHAYKYIPNQIRSLFEKQFLKGLQQGHGYAVNSKLLSFVFDIEHAQWFLNEGFKDGFKFLECPLDLKPSKNGKITFTPGYEIHFDALIHFFDFYE